MPQLRAAGGLRVVVRCELDAEADGRPQFGGARLVVQSDGAEQALQPEGEGREGLRGARLQSVDGAAAGDDDEEDSVSARSRRVRGVDDGEGIGGGDAEAGAPGGDHDLRSLARD